VSFVVKDLVSLGVLAVQLFLCFSWRLGGSNIDLLPAGGRTAMKEYA
jgi:hypothetical protein